MKPTEASAESEAPPPQRAADTKNFNTLVWTVGVLAVAAFIVLVPLWAAVLLAAWCAIIARPLHKKLTHWIHQREGAAATVTVLLVIALVTPLVVVALSLSGAAFELVEGLLAANSGGDALKALAANGDGAELNLQTFDWRQWMELAERHGKDAMAAARVLFGLATVAVIGAVVFVACFYTFLVEGQRSYAWLLDRSPLSRGNSHRLASTFKEVGRGLLIGVGLTALLQGAVATVGYVVTGVPRPLVLGLLTVFASLIPTIGSGLVWVPVAAGLAMTGRTGAAVTMLVIGCVVSVVDNLLRPLLSKYGQLRMHGLLLFIAMLGGIAVFGGGGLLLGPLFVRLAMEGLTMLQEHRAERTEQ
jgi:predicted PurR-regulated permease PerM